MLIESKQVSCAKCLAIAVLAGLSLEKKTDNVKECCVGYEKQQKSHSVMSVLCFQNTDAHH